MDVRERKVAVARGYEAIAAEYTAAKDDSVEIQGWVDDLVRLITPGGRVLDLGCGAATPYTQRLAARFPVAGVDLARAQLRLARRNIPAGAFLQGDICALPFAAGQFDGALSLYAIIHVPRMEHPRLLTELQRVLRPGSPVLLVMGAQPLDDDWDEYHGVRMYWSHFGERVNRRLVEEAGFTLLRHGYVAESGGSGHTFLLARTPGVGASSAGRSALL